MYFHDITILDGEQESNIEFCGMTKIILAEAKNFKLDDTASTIAYILHSLYNILFSYPTYTAAVQHYTAAVQHTLAIHCVAANHVVQCGEDGLRVVQHRVLWEELYFFGWLLTIQVILYYFFYCEQSEDIRGRRHDEIRIEVTHSK